MDVCALSATELRAALGRGELSAVEALEAVLCRADEITASVNPFSARLDAAARAAAQAADRALAAGEGGPLCGIPVSTKDSHWMSGVESTSASRARLGFVPTETTASIERLQAAGAVIFARTTVPEFCYFGVTESALFGRTSNPWDTGRTCGGSSGGAAAAVASGCGPVSLGGDGGGSIRIPAAFCGIVGFKPTFGVIPHEPSSAGWKTLVAVGPLTRSVADARLVLATLAGYDARDRHSVPAPPFGAAGPEPGKLRLAVSEDLGFAPLDDDVRDAFRAAVGKLADAGAQLVPDSPGLGTSAATWATIALAEARYSEAGEYATHRAELSEAAVAFIEAGGQVTAEQYVRPQFAREHIHRAYAGLFARTGASALITPALGCQAFPHGTGHPAAIGGVPVTAPDFDWAPFLYDANLAGLPACALPMGLGDAGLPVSMQVLGMRCDDDRVLAAAQTIETVLGFDAHPPAPWGVPMSEPPPVFRGVSDLREFFRTNQIPVYFISPTAFNLLGIDRWVRNFHYVNYFDSFEGTHPNVFVPVDRTAPEFESIEDICNYLLRHPEITSWMAGHGSGGRAVFVMFDEETEALAARAGLRVAHPPAGLRHRLDSKIVTTQLGNDAGVPSVPNVLGRAATYPELLTLADRSGLGRDLVVQMPYGDSGKTTFFIKSPADWAKYAAKEPLAEQELKVMRRIEHRAIAVEALLTRHGTLVGPLMNDITGHPELTPYRGGWAGNDYPATLTAAQKQRARDLTGRLGDRLAAEGYVGFFEVDFLVDTGTGELYLGELNPRISGISSMTNVTAGAYADLPLFLFHLLEYLW